MKKEEIIKLLRSGNFTLAGHDSGIYFLYEGKFNYENLPEEGQIAIFEDWHENNGYITEIISILTEALGGKTDSI